MEKILQEYPIRIVRVNNSENGKDGKGEKDGKDGKGAKINSVVEEIFIINLDTDVARRTYIQLLMKKLGISYRLVIAKKPNQTLYNKVRGYQQLMARTTAEEENQGEYKTLKTMSIGEAGCYLTHMWCLRYITNNRIKNAIIFEDDIIIHKSWKELFERHLISTVGDKYDLLLLGAADHGFNRGNSLLVKDGVYIPQNHVIMGTHAIYYSAHGARKIFEYRLHRPEYFDRNMRHFFTMFDKDRCGVCYPNIFTVENSTTNLHHNFGITKYKYNDYYYRECYGEDFRFKDYHIVYLDLFQKAALLDLRKYRSFDCRRFVNILLMNYFNNDRTLSSYHMERLDTRFFTLGELFSIILSIQRARPYDSLYYRHYIEFCRDNKITPGRLMSVPELDKQYREKYWGSIDAYDIGIGGCTALFHKQNLGLIRPFITYEEPINGNTCGGQKVDMVAHLHCYDLSRFGEIYGEYLERIREFSSMIIITYCISDGEVDVDFDISQADIVMLKVPNYGYDIGAKFSAIKYLRDTFQSYDYILFLHSKSCEYTRRIYFNSLINNLSCVREKCRAGAEAGAEVGGFFPPTIHRGNNSSIIYDNKYLFKNDLSYSLYHQPVNNRLYVDELLEYLYPESKAEDDKHECTIWSSGNCYILRREIAEKIFGDETLYGCLNAETDFDYNWVRLFYKIPHDNIRFIYEYYREKGLCGNNLENINRNKKTKDTSAMKHKNPDMMVEDAFERIIFRVIGREKMGIQIFPNEKNREQILELSREISNAFKMVEN